MTIHSSMVHLNGNVIAAMDYETTGLSLASHPMALMRNQLESAGTIDLLLTS